MSSTTAILGGGISGLSAAYYLAKNAQHSVHLLEKSSRLGGWIQTENVAKLGVRFEHGPRTIRPAGVKGGNTLRMIEELQLHTSLLPISSSHVAAKNRMIFADGQLCALPSSVLSAFKRLPPFTKPLIACAVHDLFAGRSSEALQDESIYSFAERRFGSEVAKYLVSSMICGICAGDAKQISVKFLMNDIFEMEQKYGGVLKGAVLEWLGVGGGKPEASVTSDISKLVARAADERWSIYSFNEGLEMLPRAIADYVQAAGTSIHMNSVCEALTLDKKQVDILVEFPIIIIHVPHLLIARLI